MNDIFIFRKAKMARSVETLYTRSPTRRNETQVKSRIVLLLASCVHSQQRLILIVSIVIRVVMVRLR